MTLPRQRIFTIEKLLFMHFEYLFTENSSINMQIVFKRLFRPPKSRFDGYPDGKQKKY